MAQAAATEVGLCVHCSCCYFLLQPCLLLLQTGPILQQQRCRLSSHPVPALAAAQAPLAVPLPTPALEALAAELRAAGDIQERSRLLLGYACRLAPLPEAARSDAHRVMGCTAQVGGRRARFRQHAGPRCCRLHWQGLAVCGAMQCAGPPLCCMESSPACH